MQQWEHMALSVLSTDGLQSLTAIAPDGRSQPVGHDGTTGAVVRHLNLLGAQGWQLVSHSEYGGTRYTATYMLRRQVG